MAGEWTTKELSELSADVSYGYTESASVEKVGPRFLRITDIQNGVVNWADVPYCPITPDNHSKYKLYEGDIVVARTGNSTGENFLYQGDEDAVFASYLIRFRIDRQKADPKFVWYNLRSRAWWDFINNSKTGSAQAGANAKVLGRFPVCHPPLPEQRAIAGVLGALDDKIEQNQRTARALERLARAIFRAWFVDFEPVKAKAAGATSFPSMPQPIFDTLPARFVDSEIGPVPEGWEVRAIDDVVSVKGGGTPSTKNAEYWDGGLHCWATPRDMSRLSHPVLLDTERRITDVGVDCISSGLLPAGTVLMSSRAPVGYLAIAGIPIAINQGFIAMVCDGPLPPTYVLQWTHASMDAIHGRASGTTFPEISKTNFRPLPVVVPPLDVVTAFQSLADPLFDLLTATVKENGSLATMRDYLLPRLLSGALRVAV